MNGPEQLTISGEPDPAPAVTPEIQTPAMAKIRNGSRRYAVLIQLKKEWPRGLTLDELTARMFIGTQTIAVLISDLIDDEFLERVEPSDSLVRTRYRLTTKGRERVR